MNQDDEWVARALEWARAEESLPSDVADRLDARLEELNVDSGRIRPRRRTGPILLAAAAAVAVVAVGVPVLRHLDADSSRPSAVRATKSSSSPTATPTSLGIPSGSAAGGERQGIVGATVRLNSTSLRADVEQHLSTLLAQAAARELGGAETAAACRATPAAGTRGALVLLDDRLSLLEISAPTGGERAVRALSCTDASTVASTTVAAS